jgi:CDP-diacylglycerol---glycerol-3-phosphate 3-phosphatidyltransferase
MSVATDATDSAFALVLLLAAAVTLLAYAVRVARHGRVHRARLDDQDRSALLGRWVMEAAYWALEPVARALVACRVGPHALSWASLAGGVVAGVAMASSRFGIAAVSGTVSGLLDTLDGMVARHTGVASAVGEVLDASMDRCVDFAVLAGIAIAYRESLGLLALSLFALFGSFMVSYSTAKAEALSVSLPPGCMRRPARVFWLLAGATASALLVPWGGSHPSWRLSSAPLLIALGLVAVLSNLSAARRLWVTARLAGRQDLGRVVVLHPGEASAPRPQIAALLRRRAR